MFSKYPSKNNSSDILGKHEDHVQVSLYAVLIIFVSDALSFNEMENIDCCTKHGKNNPFFASQGNLILLKIKQ